jgi:hypothetical protein
MPPYLAWVDPWMGEVDSTNLLAAVVGTDPLPDLHISRLPVNSSIEMDAYIQKLQGYEASPALLDWHRETMFVADNTPDPTGDFVAYSENIINTYVNSSTFHQANRIYEDNYAGCPADCSEVTYDITNTLNNTGALLVNYVGHSSTQAWSHEKIFTNLDVLDLNNIGRLPVFLSMTCLDGYWFGPAHPKIYPGLIEVLIRADGGGAIGAFSPTGLGVATGHDVINQGFFKSLYVNGNWELGGASLNAKLDLYATGYNFDLLNTYTIFGDAALKIKSQYQFDMSPSFSSQSDVPGRTVTYTLAITNTGAQSDTYEVVVNENVWPILSTGTPAGPIDIDDSSTITITVSIPASVESGDYDTALVTVSSVGDQAQYYESQIITTANSGVKITPASDSKSSAPGTTVYYNFEITNISEDPDSYEISVQNSPNWSPGIIPFTIGPLLPSKSYILNVEIQIPTDANENETDTTIIRVQSQLDAGKKAVAIILTTAKSDVFNIFLPHQYK